MINRVQTRMQRRDARQRGFTMLAGVMLITILAALSAFMISFRVYQDAGVSLDTLGTRAYAAAHAYVEWGIYTSLQNKACTAASTPFPQGTLGGTLSGFAATVTCTDVPFDEGDPANPVNIYTIVATACNAATCPAATPGANYAERQITITVGK